MPTSYTADVQNGKIKTLREFALLCARGMGFAITMRDDSFDTPLPAAFKADTKYHDEQIAQANDRLKELHVTSLADCNDRAGNEFLTKKQQWNERQGEKGEQRKRYEEMLASTRNWNAPKELLEMKDFMIEQLIKSIDFDCPKINEYDQPPVRLGGEEWREKAIASALSSLNYHSEARDKEITRAGERNHYLNLLRDSLPKK